MHLRNQRTISTPVTIDGFGFWSGRDVRVEFRPAEIDTGIVFVRRDLPRTPHIPASVAHRIETPRRTTLTADGGSVEMIEHVMAALAGLHIDNCEVWLNEPELPGCDGSSRPFVDVLDAAGVVEQKAVRPQLIIRNITRLGDEDSWIEARPAAADGLSIKYRLDYGSGNAIGRQTLQVSVTPDTFRRELAAARTFVLEAEARWLLERGLGARATCQNLLVFGEHGPVDNELRYRDECVRHKILDAIGDLALAGCDLVGQIVAHKSGHRLNAELVRAILKEEKQVEGRRRSA